MTHDPKAMLKLADEIAQYTYDGWISLKASDSATIVAALRSAAAHQSAPAVTASHNSGEGLPNSDAASAGAGTNETTNFPYQKIDNQSFGISAAVPAVPAEARNGRYCGWSLMAYLTKPRKKKAAKVKRRS